MSSVDKSTIENLQKKDSTLKKCFDRIGKPIIRENYVGEFYKKNGLLYRKHQETKTGRSFNQLVVPKELRRQVMSVNHESAFSGHLGAKKTEVRILPNFFWPGRPLQKKWLAGTALRARGKHTQNKASHQAHKGKLDAC